MQNDEEKKKDDLENVHPDSKYNNWTIRSYEVKTRYEDIPQWMKMYAESSIDTHEFFKFDRFEYNELDNWQKMLLKLYREDLRKVIRYYEDYRASLLREIMDRTKREKEQVSADPEQSSRHAVCSKQEKPTVSLSNKQQLQNLMSLDKLLPIDGKTLSPTNSISPTLLSPGDMSPSSPSNSVSPNSVRFKRFGKKKTKTRHQEQSASNHPQTSSTPSNHSNSSHVTGHVISPENTMSSSGSSPDLFGSLGDVARSKESIQGSEHEIIKEFESPKLERRKSSRRSKPRRLLANWFNTENVDRNNTHDFPSPLHTRSASTRHSTVCNDFPSPLLLRSSSDRPDKRHSVHSSFLRGVQFRENSVSSCNTFDSDESSLSAHRRSNSRIISSPKLKTKSEPGTNNVTIIPASDKKEKKIPKFFSRAASFGRKDKHRSKASPPDSRKRAQRSDVRVSRRDAFLSEKEGVSPKETAV